MKKWLLQCLIYSLPCFIVKVNAQNLVPFKTKDSWGFVERNKDSLQINGFEQAEYFKGSYAIVKQNGLYGALDNNLNISIPIEYDKIEYLSEDLLRATQGSKMDLYSQKALFNEPYKDFAFLGDYDSLIITADKNGKYGMMNLEGEIIIPNIYEGPPKEELPGILVFPLRENVLSSRKKSKKIFYGAIDFSGKEIIPFEYLFLDRYGTDYIKATTMNEQVFFTLKGDKVEISKNAQFHKTEFFTEVFIGNNLREVYATNQKRPIVFKTATHSDDCVIGTDTNDAIQVLDKRGKHVLVNSSYKYQGVKNGLIKVCKFNQSGRCSGYGLINLKGDIVLPAIYANIFDWNLKYAVCSDTTVNLRVGMIDLSNNKKVLDFKHRIIKLMNCGYSIADEHPEVKLYNSSIEETAAITAKDIIPGKTRISIEQSFIEDARNRLRYKSGTDVPLMEECSATDRQAITSVNGLGLIKDKYGNLPSSDMFVVNIKEDNYKYFLIDKDGLAITEAKYSAVLYREKDLILIYEKDSTGFRNYAGALNLEGKQVISSSYDKIEEVYPEMLIVAKHGVLGVVSREEETIIPIRYNSITYHPSGYYLLRKFSQWKVADKDGKVLTKKYDEILDVYPEGIFKVKLDDQEFFVDDKGKEYIER